VSAAVKRFERRLVRDAKRKSVVEEIGSEIVEC
jgi:hypothetical protein